MELQTVRMLCKKKVLPQRFFFALIGKDIQKDFTKTYEILDFGLMFCLFQMSVSGKSGMTGRNGIQVPR